MELDLIAITRKQLVEDQNIRQQIERRAFELYMDRGCVDGYHQEDWIKAEDEILAPLLREALNLSTAGAVGKASAQIGSNHVAADFSSESASSSAPHKKGTSRPKTATKSTAVRRPAMISAKSTKAPQAKTTKRKEPVTSEKAILSESAEKKHIRPKVRKSDAKTASSLSEDSF
jgi:hypothetical protein